MKLIINFWYAFPITCHQASPYRNIDVEYKKYLSVLLDRIHYKTLLTIFLLRQRKFFVVL